MDAGRDAGRGRDGRRRARQRLAIGLIALAVLLGIAWFDGGEEPIRPIAVELPVPGAQ